jgi:hypothetical protein
MSDVKVPAAERIGSAMVEKLIESLEAGVATGQWKQPWTTSKQINAITGASYSGANAINLMLIGKECPYWATFNQWSTAGYRIPQGTESSGFVHTPPRRNKKTESGEEITVFVPSKTFVVFNGSQVVDADGNPFTWEAPPPVPVLPEIEAFFAKHNPTIVHDDPSSAYYHPSKDLINMPPINSFVDNVSYYGTLAHEMIHWTAHKDRLDRDLSQYGRDRKVRAFEELVAEFGAAIIGSELGLATEVRDDHLQYLASWLAALKEDKTVLRRAVTEAGKASAYVSRDAE